MIGNLLDLEPHKVSRDLSGYYTYIFGPPKTGKTTLASQMPSPLILAFEKGYNAIPGVFAQDVTSWSDMKAVVRQLKNEKVKEKFKTIAVDTVDLAGTLCEKYVCSQNGINAIGDLPYGQGWAILRKEFEEVFRSIAQLGYAVFFISHSKEKTIKRDDAQKTEYMQIVPSASTTFNAIVENMVDIYGYMHQTYDEEGKKKVVITFRSDDNSIVSGGRLKYLPKEIDANYEALKNAVISAIDKEAEEHNNEFVTNERNVTVVKELNYSDLMNEFDSIVKKLIDTRPDFEATISPRIVAIASKHLGTGKKISDCTPEQVEVLAVIVDELKEL